MSKLHFTIINLQFHLERTFDLWTAHNPSPTDKFKRSAIFILALLTTIYFPLNDLFLSSLGLLLIWILLSLSHKKIPRTALLINMMINIRFLFELTNYFLFLLAPESSSFA